QARKDCDFSFAGLKNAFRLAVTRAEEEYGGGEGVQGGQEEGASGMEEGGTSFTGRHVMSCHVSKTLPESVKADLCASFQHTAIRHLEERVRRAMDAMGKMYPSPPLKSTDARGEGSVDHGVEREEGEGARVMALAVVGGVAANQEVRRRLQALCDERPMPWKLVVPPTRLCTDNGVMVAWAGIERLRKGMQNNPE
ncbi:unnamed protein product, partial [Choristocarpus tenellus]